MLNIFGLSQKLQSIWKRRFDEDVDGDLLYVVAVERVLQIDDFMEVCAFFSSYISFYHTIHVCVMPITITCLCGR